MLVLLQAPRFMIKNFSCSILLSMKFVLLVNPKLLTIYLSCKFSLLRPHQLKIFRRLITQFIPVFDLSLLALHKGQLNNYLHMVCATVDTINEPQRQKTYLRAYAPGEDSDQPVHSPSLIRIFSGHILDSQESKFPKCLHADNEDYDRMHSLI